MKIVIEVIPHKDQAYDTCGDWRFDGDTLQIRVSSLDDWRQEALIAVHELVEAVLCKHVGVIVDIVDEFDKAFPFRSDTRPDEPGDDPTAPYCKQHCIATGIERIVAAELGVDWYEYEIKIGKLKPSDSEESDGKETQPSRHDMTQRSQS